MSKQVEVLLDTSNPNNLIYKGSSCVYAIKGFNYKQVDSLKVTLQLRLLAASEGITFLTTKLDLYEFSQISKQVAQIIKKLPLDEVVLEHELYTLTRVLEEYKEELLQEHAARYQPTITPVPVKEAKLCKAFLKKKGLLKLFNQYISKAGIMGLDTTTLVSLFG